MFMALLALGAAAPVVDESRRTLPALDHEEIHDEYGQFALRYVTAEGTVVSERGRLVPNLDGTGYVMVIEGEVSYIGDDGKIYATKYSAGLDGTHVEGNHLPVPVTAEPVPEPIVTEEPVIVERPIVGGVAEPYKY
ncbi:hypothetical protein HF086_003754 [Spodoptera exigua]|uniref:Uncharacterized protein n=1 Tax=Spodoptera exigua TaxID=7107 RepID=A0A922SNJ1_SPOEX|nr:hypothetical protein HF086_003754 [Spodoptera exigua]